MNNTINLTTISGLNNNNNNNNSIRTMLESNLENETTNTYSHENLINQIETLKNGIQYGSIIQMKEIDIINVLRTVISCKENSTIHENMYVDFMNFLEFHDTQYSDKFKDLVNHILENISEEEKQTLYRDEDGNPVLLSKPRLERNYNDTYMTRDIKEDDLYKLTIAVIRKMKNIRQYEEDYCNTKLSTASTGSYLCHDIK